MVSGTSDKNSGPPPLCELATFGRVYAAKRGEFGRVGGTNRAFVANYSVAMAARTSRREARRAGPMAAMTPMMPAATV